MECKSHALPLAKGDVMSMNIGQVWTLPAAARKPNCKQSGQLQWDNEKGKQTPQVILYQVLPRISCFCPGTDYCAQELSFPRKSLQSNVFHVGLNYFALYLLSLMPDFFRSEHVERQRFTRKNRFLIRERASAGGARGSPGARGYLYTSLFVTLAYKRF